MLGPLVVILAGGGGTRIRHLLPELPKPLAPAAGRPFLEWVIRYLRKQGLGSIVISAGYRAERLEPFAKEQKVILVREKEALGTGGGFIHALAGSGDAGSDVIACNGDSLVLANLAPLLKALGNASVDAALLGVRAADASRYGTLQVGTDGALLGFAEKRSGAGMVNGGVYYFRRVVTGRFPAKRPLSFEYDVFPALLASGTRIKVVPCEAPFLDIGTEESLAQADEFIRSNMEWFE